MNDNKNNQRRVMARVTAVQEILRRFDPIGVRPGIDGPLDEYDTYAHELVSIADRGGCVDELRAALQRIVTEKIGLESNPEVELACAREIYAAHCATRVDRPADTTPTEFERSVFRWIAERAHDPELGAQLARAEVAERWWTVVGCYTRIAVPDDAPASTRPYAGRGPLDGPCVKSSALKYGAGTLLWFREGRAHQLEIFTYDDTFPEDHADLGEFELFV